MFEKFSAPARAAVTLGREEAIRHGDRRIGTDHILLGLLHDPRTAAIVGTSVDEARATAASLDRAALSAIGINVGDYPLPTTFGASRHTPLTAGARTVLKKTLALATAEHSRTITSTHLLQAILDQSEPDAAATLLGGLGIERSTLAARIAEEA